MSHEQQHDIGNGRSRWVLLGFLAIGAFFLLTEHRAHLFGILPYLLLLACPLMHLFHRHGHHHRGRPDGNEAQPLSSQPGDTGRNP